MRVCRGHGPKRELVFIKRLHVRRLWFLLVEGQGNGTRCRAGYPRRKHAVGPWYEVYDQKENVWDNKGIQTLQMIICGWFVMKLSERYLIIDAVDGRIFKGCARNDDGKGFMWCMQKAMARVSHGYGLAVANKYRFIQAWIAKRSEAYLCSRYDERTPQYPCSNLILVESSFGTLVETSMDGPAGLVFGPAGAALGPAELAQKTPN
ncbi:hypothetical protein Tco_0006844 [Tanacetum coccineum]